MAFWNKSTGSLKQLNYYNSLDTLPIKIWFEIFKTGDYTLLLIDKTEVKEEHLVELNESWEEMFNEWINKFGFSEQYLENLQQKISIAKLQAEYIITGQRHFKTLIRIEKEELKANEIDTSEPIELDQTLWKMSKHYGFKLNSRELTVTEYYSAINDIKDGR